MPDGQSQDQSVRKESGSALSKAVGVLGALLRADRAMSLADLADILHLPRQTVHRVIGQLADEGLIRRVPGGDGYVVGPAMVELSLDALSAAGRTAPMQAILDQLVGVVGETCNVGVLDRDDVVYIARVECDWPLRMQIGVGTRATIHASAIGKLLLAHLPSRTRRRILQSRPLEQLTEFTVTNPDDLECQLADIRRQGYALNDQENIVGMIGFAVPVRDTKGRVVAGVALHAPKARMSTDAALEHLTDFRAAAARIEALIADMAESGPDADAECEIEAGQ